MQLDSAREVIQALSQKLHFPIPMSVGHTATVAAGVMPPHVNGPISGLGVSVRGPNDYGVAIRLRSRNPMVRQFVGAALAALPPKEVSVQYAGHIRAVPAGAKHRKRHLSSKLTDPLRIGESVGHVRLSGAGTLGCFVTGNGAGLPKYGIMR